MCLLLVLATAVQAQLNIEVIYCEIPTDPRSTVPGAKDAGGNPVVTKFKALEDFRVSHDGEAWVLKGKSQLGSELENCLLLGSGLTGDMFAQEGQPFQGGGAGELYEFFDATANPASFDTAGNIGFSARAKGGSSAIDEKVVVYNATTEVHTIVFQEGDPALGLVDNPPNPSGDEIFGSTISSVYARDEELVGFVNTPIGNCHSSRYPAFFVGSTSFRQSGVSTIDGFTWDSFDFDDCGGTPDGLHWYAKGDIENVPSTSNRILAVDDTIELRRGSVLPGSTMTMDDIHHTKMVSNGDWFSRGDDPANDDWAVYNGTLVAETGDEIGSTGEHLGAVFLSFGGNRVGDWVLVANTDDPDNSRDTVLLLNGQVVIREGDPIDLDGNGAFDDDVFIGRGNNTSSAFAANDIFLGDGGMLYFIAPLRNAAGDDLGSDPPFGSGGEAFLRVSLSCPAQPGDSDGDGDTDLDDYTVFAGCMDGPVGGVGPGCGCFDFDESGGVDLRDFAGFQEVFTGSLP
jgi:hypothetical protein